jgi:apolipoprotein N-acyltransferase
MKFPWYTRLLLALASGATLALAFPNFNLWPLAWVSIALLILACWRERAGMAILYGFLHALVFYVMDLSWIDVVVRQYGNVEFWIAAILLVLMSMLEGIVLIPFCWLIAFTSKRNQAIACALAPFLWVALEFGHTHVSVLGFPWNLVGYVASGNLALVQLTTLTGIYGLSFIVAGWSALLAYAILSGRHRAWQGVLVVTAVLIFVALGCRDFVPADQPRYVAHLVQTNFAQSYEYPSDWMLRHAADLNQLAEISINSARKLPGLIVWPEVPAPFTMVDPDFSARARQIARESGVDFLVGVEDWKRVGGQWEASNSAVLLAPTGQRLFTYDKIHLVPWGEYVPWRKELSFAGKLTADIGDFTPGQDYSVGRLPMAETYVPSPGSPFSTFICYEAIFPDLVRHFTANGAALLINMSNDGWFGRSSAPAQHLMMARVRAVENRRWLLRDTNNGFTVSVDPYGRIVAQLPPDVRGVLDAPYDWRFDRTIYVRFGDWFAWLCVLAALVLIGLAVARRRSSVPVA